MAETAASLTEDQIEQLLQEAEARLAAKASAQNATSLTKPAKLDVAKASSSAQPAKTSTTEEAVAKEPTPSSELVLHIPPPRVSKKDRATKTDAGASWYNLPRTDLTPQLKRDLQLLKMRDVLDSKRHYKKDNSRGIPEYSHVGTMIEGRTEYFTNRVTKKDKKRTLLESVMDQENSTKRFKSKYGQIQEAKTSGKKGHYKKMMQKRYGSKK
ncbi:nucleolus protein required for cell viability [Apiospora phragmitis]|uniref:Nucleolus protein required for cell viability n=1 Tax=Apiospora phragmitis TaxID=2905665 RepID=A0ABR1W1G6_9PEZI